MRAASLLALALPLVCADNATQLFITQPSVDTTWTAGQNGSVQWNLANATAANASLIQFSLVFGDSSNVAVIGDLGKHDPNQKMFSWAVPDSLPTGNLYSIRAGDGPSFQYGVDFKVANAKLDAKTPVPTLGGGTVPNHSTVNSQSASTAPLVKVSLFSIALMAIWNF